jgi:hypothetical protein
MSNIERQRELAQNIVALKGSLEVRETGKPTRAVWDYAPELAELVLARETEATENGGKVVLTFQDGDSYAAALSGLDDYLVEIERIDGPLVSGYVHVTRTGLYLREHFDASRPGGSTRVGYDHIKAITVL